MINLYLGVGIGDIHPQHKAVMQANPGDWVLVDNFVERPDILKMDAGNLTFEDNSVNLIYASHLLEHFEIRKVKDVLSNWYRVLSKGGKVIINVPDLDWICQAWLNRDMRLAYWKDDYKMLEAFFGGQDGPGEIHYTAFNEKLLRDQLTKANFKDIQIKKEIEAHEEQCLIAEAAK